MGASAIAIPIKVATTLAARFTIYLSTFRPAPFSRSPDSAGFTASIYRSLNRRDDVPWQL
jgi:hypothetical protein